MSQTMILWLVVVILAVGIEALTMGLTSIWFAGGALVALAAAALNLPISVQVILFFAVSLILLFFTRPIAVKYFNKDRVKTNAESLVGRPAIVTSEIDNLQSIGKVTVGGQEWSARSIDEDVKVPLGTVVTIMAINGVKLMVKPDPQMEKSESVKKTEEANEPNEPNKEVNESNEEVNESNEEK